MGFKVVYDNKVMTPKAYNVKTGDVLLNGEWVSLEKVQKILK